MFTQDFLEHFVQQSNLYAEQKKTNLQLTVEEFKAFLGVLTYYNGIQPVAFIETILVTRS